MMKRAFVIALTIVGSVAATGGAALADKPDNHNICVVYSPNQRYTDTTYYCVTIPDVPPAH